MGVILLILFYVVWVASLGTCFYVARTMLFVRNKYQKAADDLTTSVEAARIFIDRQTNDK